MVYVEETRDRILSLYLLKIIVAAVAYVVDSEEMVVVEVRVGCKQRPGVQRSETRSVLATWKTDRVRLSVPGDRRWSATHNPLFDFQLQQA